MGSDALVSTVVRAGCVTVELFALHGVQPGPEVGASVKVDTLGCDGCMAILGFDGSWIFRDGAAWVRDGARWRALLMRGTAEEVAAAEAERIHPLMADHARRLGHGAPALEYIARDLAACLRAIAARPEAMRRPERVLVVEG